VMESTVNTLRSDTIAIHIEWKWGAISECGPHLYPRHGKHGSGVLRFKRPGHPIPIALAAQGIQLTKWMKPLQPVRHRAPYR
jgi:hypothetical protein